MLPQFIFNASMRTALVNGRGNVTVFTRATLTNHVRNISRTSLIARLDGMEQHILENKRCCSKHITPNILNTQEKKELAIKIYKIGLEYFNKHQYEEAGIVFKRMFQLDPLLDFTYLLRNLSVDKVQSHQIDKHFADMEKNEITEPVSTSV